MAQLKFSSAFGEETIDLPPRTADHPFTVGRGADCDLQIPSATTAPRHCVLFQHKGKWAAEDAGSQSGTFLNGLRLTGAHALQAGDVLTLGQDADPPTLVIEGAELAQRPVAPSSPASSAASAYVASFIAPPPPAEEEPYIAEVVAAAPSAPRAARSRISSAEIPVSTDTRYYIPKRKGMSPIAWVITLLLMLGLCVGGYYVYQQTHQEEVAAPPPPAPVVVESTPVHSDNIFDEASHQLKKPKHVDASPQPTVVTAPAAPAIAPVAPVVRKPIDSPDADPTIPAAPPSSPEADAEKESDGWKNIEAARQIKQGLQIVKACQDYLEFNPDTKLKPEIDKAMTEGCDILWWTRVDELCRDDADLREKIDAANRDYAVSHDDAFKKDLADQRTKLRDELAGNETELHTKMGYASATSPNLFDNAAVAKLRAARDPKAFDDFKKSATRSIHLRNRPPWQG